MLALLRGDGNRRRRTLAGALTLFFALFVLAVTGLHHHGGFGGYAAGSPAAGVAFTNAAPPAPFCPVCDYLTHAASLAVPLDAPGPPLLRPLVAAHRPPTLPGFEAAPRTRHSRAPPRLLLSQPV